MTLQFQKPDDNHDDTRRVTLLLLTGTMGAGKTTVLAEASDILKIREIPHAMIDLDALDGACVPNAYKIGEVRYENLAAISQNYRRLGVTRFIVAGAMESRDGLDRCCKAIGPVQTTVCRLMASGRTMQERVAQRERGILRNEFVSRVTVLDAILHKAALEHFVVSTEGRGVTEIAQEVLIRAGWISE